MHMNDLLKYLQNTMGFDAELNPIEKNKINGLPLFVKSGYHIYEAIIFNHKAIVLESINGDYQTPDALSKQKIYLEQKVGFPIIFVSSNYHLILG